MSGHLKPRAPKSSTQRLSLHRRSLMAVIGALALLLAPAVTDLPGIDGGAAHAKNGNGGGNGGGRGNGGGGNRGGGNGGGKSARSGGIGGEGGIGVRRQGTAKASRGNRGGRSAATRGGGSRSSARSTARSSRSSGGGESIRTARAKTQRTVPAGSTSRRRSVAEVQEMTSTSIAPVERPGKSNHGALASELKGLNAAHASEQAFANASPNSRVGRIAAYRNAVIGAAAAGTALGDAEAALAAFDAELPDGPTAADLDAQIAAYDDLAELTPEQEAERALLMEAYDAAVIAEAERAAAREELATAVETAASEAELSGGGIEDLFLAASDGRTLSPEAMDEFHRLLGIEDEVATLASADAGDEVVEEGAEEGGDDVPTGDDVLGEDGSEDDADDDVLLIKGGTGPDGEPLILPAETTGG